MMPANKWMKLCVLHGLQVHPYTPCNSHWLHCRKANAKFLLKAFEVMLALVWATGWKQHT
jgi:hypothetical protein